MTELITDYGEKLDKDNPLPEHPNPQFARDSFISLNGFWDFSIDKTKDLPSSYDRKIVVPFSVESPLSGIGIKVSKGVFLHYRKSFVLPDSFLDKAIILHFEAIDQIADVFLNGRHIAHHEGGYFPISVYIPDAEKVNLLELTVTDDTDSPVFPRGKQSNVPGGIWYHPTSGIWQSVWIESVPSDGHFVSVKITPNYDDRKVQLHAIFYGNHAYATAEAYYHGKLVAKAIFDENGDAILDFKYDFYAWTPDDPNLYDLRFLGGHDIVHSYFGLRKFSVYTKGKYRCFALNDKPLFLSAVLDQGYYPDGGMTPPSDQAMINDIKLLKKCGFNCVRKHIKIELMRWYYYCDTLGILVSQDFVNGGARYSDFLIKVRPFINFDINDTSHLFLGRFLKESRAQYLSDMTKTIVRLANVVSICIWTPFNEGWGQFEARSITQQIRSLDNSRLIDSTSGWYDKKVGDFNSRHVYFRPARLLNDRERILALTEFGGYSLPVDHHDYSNSPFGYKMFTTFESYNHAVQLLYRDQVLHLVEKHGLAMSVYTQLTDIEDEINGLITFDRKIIKIDQAMIHESNRIIANAFSRKFI
jgi:beta-galactosidase/beta-glucuronidase